MKFLIVDGHNILNAWESLKALARRGGIGAAVEELLRQLELYQSYSGAEVTVVLDGPNPRGKEAAETGQGLQVMYSGRNRSADGLIERLVYEHRKSDEVIVATSDRQEAAMVMGFGGFVMSALEFEKEVQNMLAEARGYFSPGKE